MEFQLRLFFRDIIYAALRTATIPGYNHYIDMVDGIIEQLVLYNERFIKKILSTEHNISGEFRLNNAGLKMYWRIKNNGNITFTIGGDQVSSYPEFVDKFKMLTRVYGFYE